MKPSGLAPPAFLAKLMLVTAIIILVYNQING